MALVSVELRTMQRLLDAFVGLSGWLSEMNYEQYLPTDLDEETAALMDEVQRIIEAAEEGDDANSVE